MIITTDIQGSPGWHRGRHGVLTASRIDQLIPPGPEPKPSRYFQLTSDGETVKLRGSVQSAIRDAMMTVKLDAGLDAAVGQLAIPGGISESLKTMITRGYVQEVPATDAPLIAPPLKLSAQRGDLLARLIHEYITGSSAEEWGGNAWSEHGHLHEPAAGEWLADVTGLDVRPVGLIYRFESRLAGCSPDLVVVEGADDALSETAIVAGAELKCPSGWTHIAWWRQWQALGQPQGWVPREHVMQVQFSLWVTDLPLWYWMSLAASPSRDGWLPPWQAGATMPPLLVECEPLARYQDAFDEFVPPFLDELAAAREELEAQGFRRAA